MMDCLDSEGTAPKQTASLQRQKQTLTDYAFLPRELHLWIDSKPGCGGVAWPAALILARYLSSNAPVDWHLKSIVELGSGTGVLSIALALAASPHPLDILATDILDLLPLMRENAVLNGVEAQVSVLELNWDHPPERQFDIILAADCVYNEAAFLPLTLCALSNKHTEILFAYKKRRKADKRFFVQLSKHFTWHEAMDDPARDSYRRDSLFLYRMRMK